MAELTKEEKEKIYLEEKERLEAQKKLKTETTSQKLTGYYVAFLGSALLIIGLFLPWAQLGMLSATAFQKTNDSIFILIVGAFLAFVGFIGVSRKKNYGLFIVILNLIAGGLLVYIHFLLEENLSGVKAFGASAQIGSGFWMCVAGVIVGLISGVMLAEKKKNKKSPEKI